MDNRPELRTGHGLKLDLATWGEPALVQFETDLGIARIELDGLIAAVRHEQHRRAHLRGELT